MKTFSPVCAKHSNLLLVLNHREVNEVLSSESKVVTIEGRGVCRSRRREEEMGESSRYSEVWVVRTEVYRCERKYECEDARVGDTESGQRIC